MMVSATTPAAPTAANGGDKAAVPATNSDSLPAGSSAPVTAAPRPDPRLVPAHDPRLAYMGRVALRDGEARLGFPGSMIRFAYRGPAPTLRFTAHSAHCYFDLSINGWETVVLHLKEGVNEIPLPAGPAPETGWVVDLTRRNEAWQGLVTFSGVALAPGGKLVPPPPWPSRRLLVIGDSITGGEYLECVPPGDAASATPRTASAGRAFGWILARQLGAQVHLVSYGGRGVVRDWQGRTDTGTAPQFFQRTLPDEPEPRWNHAEYQPDVVVVVLGQNDFSTGLPPEAEYTAAYARFVAGIRAAHPHAAIVLAGSPMHSDVPDSSDAPKRAQLRRTLEAVVEQRRAAGDTRLALAEIRYQPGTVLNAHPVAFQHELIAQDLVGPVKALTGW